MSAGPVFGPGFNAQLSGTVALERTLGMPPEGPKCIPITLDFTIQDSYTLDLSPLNWAAKLSMIQTVFVDSSTSAVDVVVTVPASQQILKIKSGTQGYYPILVPNPIKLLVKCPGGPVDVRLELLNFPIPHGQWTV
jgi:hypothetical protein